MIRTFLDSGVLLTATRSGTRDRERALRILEDSDRIFLTSPFVYLELVSKTIYHKKHLERAFYEEYFGAATWVRELDKIESVARAEAAQSGLAAMDALHIAASHLAQSDEFVTTERPGKPIYRSSLIIPVYLFD